MSTVNPMDEKIQSAVLQYLDGVRSQLGEDAWKTAVKKQVIQALRFGGTYADFWQERVKEYDWLDMGALKQEAASMPAEAMDVNQLLAQTFKKRMPGMKTQAQFTTFRAAFDAFEAVVNNIFDGNAAKETESRQLLDQAFLACKQATDISRKLADVPEAATSKAAEEFKRPPAEFAEYDVQQALLGELGKLEDLIALKEWYETSKPRRDAVKSQTLRNILMDAIRSRKMALTPEDPPKDAS